MGRWGRGNKATTPVTDWEYSNDEVVSDLNDASREFSWLSGRGEGVGVKRALVCAIP